MKTLTVICAAALLATTAAATAKPPLREVKEINDKLFWGALAHEIAEQCPTLDSRKFKAVNDLWGLARRAQELGYTRDEIKSFIRSKEEKARLRARGTAYLTERGVQEGVPETFCTFGHAEIDRNSAIGAYLKAK